MVPNGAPSKMNPGLTIALAAVLLCAGSGRLWAGAEPLASRRLVGDLQLPVYVTYAPGDTQRLYVVEKPGAIRVVDRVTGALNPAALLDINDLVGGGNSPNDERGLLGIAFHPDYQRNGFFYVNYTGEGGETHIVRYTALAPDQADPASAVNLLELPQPQGNHNGGWLDFGPNDGYLYIATGDGGNFCDGGEGHTPDTGNAQDLTDNLLGKILRLDVDGGSPYAIPASNPFVGLTGDDEIWAYGLRNPYRCSFDRQTGDLYLSDVGQAAREEIDYQSAGSAGGENYGWRCTEGDVCSSTADSFCPTTGCTCNGPGLTAPIHAYSHTDPPPNTPFVCAVIGGVVYRGAAIPSLDGTYLFSDFCAARIWTFRVVGGALTDFADRTADLSPSLDGQLINQIAAFGEDALGEVYIVDQGSGSTGQIFKIVPPPPVGDINGDGIVNAADLALLLGNWSQPGATDLNRDGMTNAADLALLLGNWT